LQTKNQNILSILNRELEGIQAIHHLRDILVIVQKLRGGSMLYGILKSNSFDKEAGNYKKNLEEFIQKLENSFTMLEEVGEEESFLRHIQRETSKLENQLFKLNRNIFDLTISNFDEYSKNIRNLNNLIIDIADASYLLSESDRNEAVLLNILVNIAMNMVENLNKLRAIGIKVINKKVKNIHDTVEIQYYVENIKYYLELLNKEFDSYFSVQADLEDNAKIIFLKHRLSKDVEYFLKLAEEEILTQDLIFIEPRYFFEQGDDLFNSETLFYNELFALFTNHIKKRIAFYSKITFREKAISFSAVVSLTFFIIYQASQLLLITN